MGGLELRGDSIGGSALIIATARCGTREKDGDEQGKEAGVFGGQGGEGERAGRGWDRCLPERVIPDPKQKAAAQPKHKKTLADLLSVTEGE